MRWSDIRKKALELVRKQQGTKVTGPEKMKAAIDELAEWIDEKLTFGPGLVGRLAEAADGPAAKGLLSLFMQEVYEEVKAGERAESRT